MITNTFNCIDLKKEEGPHEVDPYHHKGKGAFFFVMNVHFYAHAKGEGTLFHGFPNPKSVVYSCIPE